MKIADSMKDATENIIASCDLRKKGLDGLAADTRKTLKVFTSNRKKMAGEQKGDLTRFVRGLSKGVEDMLKGFQRDCKQMSEEQKNSLGYFKRSLAKDIGSMLNGFQDERIKKQEEFRDKLTKEVKNIKTDVIKLLNETNQLLKEYSLDMKKARGAWHGMASALAKSRKGSEIPKIEAEKKVAVIEEGVVEKKDKKTKAAEERRKMASAYMT